MTSIIMDTREKQGKKQEILESLERLGFNVVRSKLYVGDWTLLNDMSTCVDTKQNMSEVYSNVIQQHERFKGECVRARKAGIRLVVLIEDPDIRTVTDVHKWENPRIKRWERTPVYKRPERPPVPSPRLQTSMLTMASKYEVEWRFCKPGEAGEAICEILLGI